MAGGYQKHGMAFEMALEAENNVLARVGRALVIKVPTLVRNIQHKGSGRVTGTLGKSVFCDFTGMIKGARAVSFEAKATTQRAKRLKDIPDHQIEYLAMVAALGGCAFIYVKDVLKNTRYLLPVDDTGYVMGMDNGVLKFDSADSIQFIEPHWINYAERFFEAREKNKLINAKQEV